MASNEAEIRVSQVSLRVTVRVREEGGRRDGGMGEKGGGGERTRKGEREEARRDKRIGGWNRKEVIFLFCFHQ